MEVWYTHIPNLGICWRWVVSFTTQLLHLQGKILWYPWWSHTWFVHCGEETIILPPIKAHILITRPVRLIDLYRPTLNKTDLFQCRLTNTKFYQNPRSTVKSEIWTAQRECDLSGTVFSLCTLYIPLLCHFVQSLHTVTMSLCVFSANC